MKIKTNSPLDKLLDGGIEDDTITNIYGPAGSGKTNVILLATLECIKNGKMVLYIDTEGSFSFDRFRQLGGDEELLKKIIFIEPGTWEDQHAQIKDLKRTIEAEKDIGLIAIDSMVTLYRLELDKENFPMVNKQLATQYSILSKIARDHKIPVLVTNQVYSQGDGIEITSRSVGHYWSKCLIELKKTGKSNCRFAIIRKHRSLPEGKSIEFEIKEKGLKEIGKFSFI
jgi:DNA repair protein RadB